MRNVCNFIVGGIKNPLDLLAYLHSNRTNVGHALRVERTGHFSGPLQCAQKPPSAIFRVVATQDVALTIRQNLPTRGGEADYLPTREDSVKIAVCSAQDVPAVLVIVTVGVTGLEPIDKLLP